MKVLKTSVEVLMTSARLSRVKEAGLDFVQVIASSEKELIEALSQEKPDILFHDIQKISRDVMASGLPNLKAIICSCTGLNHVDLEACNELRIQLANSPGGNAEAVAEFAMAQLLGNIRKTREADLILKEGRWDRTHLWSTGLKGQTIGVLGNGKIVKNFQRMAAPFGLKCKIKSNISRVEADGNLVVRAETLEDLIDDTIGVLLAVPITSETKEIINESLLKRIRRDSPFIIINVGRGELINKKDMISHLKRNPGHFYASDVFQNEPSLDYPSEIDESVMEIIRLPNVIASPHIASTSEASDENVFNMILDNMIHFKETGKLKNLVTKF